MAAAGRSLAALLAEFGAIVPCAGNQPLDMSDPSSAWFVEEGAVDLFLVEHRGGVRLAAPEHVVHAGRGRLVPGVAPQSDGTTLSLIAKGLPGTFLRRIPLARLAETGHRELATLVDAWITDLSALLSRDVEDRPRADILVEAGQAAPDGVGTVSARRGVAWVEAGPRAGLFLGLIDPLETASATGGLVPLTPATWRTPGDAAPAAGRSSEALAGAGRLLPALAGFHAVALALVQINRKLAVLDQANLERARSADRRREEERGRRRLFDLYGRSARLGADAADANAALHATLRIIGRSEGIDFKWPAGQGGGDAGGRLDDILDASGVRARRVRIDRDDEWRFGNSGALLAFRRADGRPVALLPGLLGRYREADPAARRPVPITPERAAALRPEAFAFYRSLTAPRASLWDLARLAGKGLAPAVLRLVGAGLCSGLVMLLPAVVLGFVVGEVIPGGEPGPLYAAAAALCAIALLGLLLHVFQGMALLRVEGHVAARAEAAFWDRLLRLSPRFLRAFPAGDLAMRGMAFQHIRDAVQGVVANAVLATVFLAPLLLLLFFYDKTLGVVAAAVGGVSLAATVALGLRQMSAHGRVARVVHGLTGRLFQFINGIATLRVGSAEGSAFAVWARDYREQKQAELRRGAAEGQLQALSAGLPLIAAAVLIIAAAATGSGPVAVADFLVVYTVLMVFQSAVARLGASFGALAAIGPALDRVQPFLAEPPEITAAGKTVSTLRGDVLLDHVSFRYDGDGPLILDDVTIHARAGEFIAIAGESGAGKSTIMRLALGLDAPTSGTVYYDGRDLRHLNIKQLRRRIGAVPQAIQLHPEDVWDNIIGDHHGADADDAWRAATLAGADRAISAMPMKMLTNVGARATSGGESQRIMIAHALLGNPRVLFLDEATNWLDNDSQATVMENLARLGSTRIVIAHRLSTLQQADRIYVLQGGKVVQEGSFAELTEAEGMFRNLMRRQMA